MELETRQPHAVLDLSSRGWKAEKIVRLLKLLERRQPMRVLEIGTGSGGIAHYLATHPSLHCNVDAVDVVDNRQVHEPFRFQQVEGVDLPFEDEIFDVVISNHVIEHVGNEDAQLRHLREIHRVMHSDGVGYLAVPNRWMLTEPHYRLKFLSWLPRRLRTPYLRWSGKGEFYDCEPLQMRQLENMLRKANFMVENLCIRALRETFEIERPNSHTIRYLRRIPDALLRQLLCIIPTLIYRIERIQAQNKMAGSSHIIVDGNTRK